MSYDIKLQDPVTGKAIELEIPHHLKGGTYCVGGNKEAALNVTYNYAPYFYRVLGDQGIRKIYGMRGVDSMRVLSAAISALKDDFHEDYWEPTEGNAKRALCNLLALAVKCPNGIWNGD